MINIVWEKTAAKQYEKLSADMKIKIAAAVENLYSWPQVKHVKKLVNRPDYRLAVGRYRVIFTVDSQGNIIIISRT
jgi:mRNA-degrading endonuclease RelE of RelBE toxin-antitoxin system